ncbi:MAG TPA: GDSL-type esterase/lipase family protein [Vicinamibacteria bacterium]|nr:GDSL-type esterase/lipase family protein [Vicinamibacteria bacterium]
MRWWRLRRLAWLGLGCAGCVPPVRAPAAPGVQRVVFVGDSLVNRSEREFSLLTRVREVVERAHPGIALELVNAGVNGDVIGGIRARLQRDVLALAPAAVVLYWDSDAVDGESPGDPPSRTAERRVAYERDLDEVLRRLTAATPTVVVSGPTLVGERRHGRNPKDHVLDLYAAINRRWCLARHATWVDTRRAAFLWLGHEAGAYRSESGRLTVDGEHLNAWGVALVAQELGTALARGLRHQHRHDDAVPPPHAVAKNTPTDPPIDRK